MKTILPRDPRAFATLSLAMALGFVVTGCSKSSTSSSPADAAPSRWLYVYNPFTSQGLLPCFHGVANNWQLSALEPVQCGWYRYAFTKGVFRFKGCGWAAVELGAHGLCPTGCSLDSFYVDVMYDNSDSVWISADPSGGASLVSTSRPFDCMLDGGISASNPYGQGQLPTMALASQVTDLLAVWKSNYYEESGDLARVKFDTATQTVSEGIGYGMLIFVFADDGSGAQQSSFDKLFAYYQKFANGNGLMNWKISGFDSVVASNAATDADLDVAVALLVAHKKWGVPKNDTHYLDAAKTLITAIKNHEINGNGYLKPGDAWDTAKNPSYFSFVAFELFRDYDSDATFWSDVIDRHYALLGSARNSSTGLLPNWIDESGAAANPGNGYANWDAFGFDAIRVPWRLAWAYLWYGGLSSHSRAKDYALGFCDFFQKTTGGDPSTIRAEYTTAGVGINATTTAGPGVIGAYAAACAVDSSRSGTEDTAYGWAMGQTASYDISYYQTSLKLLEVLLLTGQALPIP